MNILQLVGAVKNANSIQGLMSMVPGEVSNNPIAHNVMNMVQNQDSKGLESFARNICKEKGVDPDNAYSAISALFGNK